jgi:phosphatidylinositol phospholipase C delta
VDLVCKSPQGSLDVLALADVVGPAGDIHNEMPLLTPHGKQFSLHQLVAMSTMMSPTHGTHLRSIVHAGGDASSEDSVHLIYLSHEIQDHLKCVYDRLRGVKVLLPKERLEEWLEKEQNQPIEKLDKDEYKFEQFLEAVYLNHGFYITKPIKPEDKDTSRPLSNYFISSSHNTYLSGNQLWSKSTTDSYKDVSCYNHLLCHC